VITEMSEGNLRVRLSRNTLEAIEDYIRSCAPWAWASCSLPGAFFILLLEFTFSRMLAGILFFLGALRLWLALK